MVDITIRTVRPNDILWLQKLTTAEGWAMSREELSVYTLAFEDDFFVALKEARPVGCVLATKHNAECGFLGLLIVDGRFRGLGIGRRLLRAALDHLETDHKIRNIGLNAEVEMAATYQKYGFKVASWPVKCYKGALKSNALEILKNEQDNVTVKTLDNSNIDQIVRYDKSIQQINRKHFFKTILDTTRATGKVALKSGEVVGFGFIAPDLKSVYHLIGPLYADSVKIACTILRHLVSDGPSVPELYAEVPEPTRVLLEPVFSALGMSVSHTMYRQYTQYEPRFPLEKVFCLVNGDSHPI